MSIRNLIVLMLFASTFCFAFDTSYTEYRELDNLFSQIENQNKEKIYQSVTVTENNDISPSKPVSELSCTNVTKKFIAEGDLEYIVYSTLFRFPTKLEHKAFQRLLNTNYKYCSNTVRVNGEVTLEEYHFIANDNSAALYFRMIPVEKEQ